MPNRSVTILENAREYLKDCEGFKGVTASDFEEFGLGCIERFRADLVDFMMTQKDNMVTKENVVAIIKNIKPEWGR